jgi:hypothetical protein
LGIVKLDNTTMLATISFRRMHSIAAKLSFSLMDSG